MDHEKLVKLAEEFEQSATSKEIEIKATPHSDPARQAMIVEMKNLQKWAKTIREALDS